MKSFFTITNLENSKIIWPSIPGIKIRSDGAYTQWHNVKNASLTQNPVEGREDNTSEDYDRGYLT